MKAGVKLKICGVTNREDAEIISTSGADYCGILVNVDCSERSLSFDKAVEIAKASTISNVILLWNPDINLAEKVDQIIKPFAIQLLSFESPEFVRLLKKRLSCKIWKTIHFPVGEKQATPDEYIEAGVDALLIDSIDDSKEFARLGGTGKVADWDLAEELVSKIPVPVILAGGINPENIEKAMLKVKPAVIDLSSGVEATKGKKDPKKIKKLVINFNRAKIKLESNL